MNGLRGVHLNEEVISAAIMAGGTNASVDFMLKGGNVSAGDFATSFGLGAFGGLASGVAGGNATSWLIRKGISPTSASLYGEMIGGAMGNSAGYIADTVFRPGEEFSWDRIVMAGGLGAATSGGLSRVKHSWSVGTKETQLKYAWEREMWSTTFGNLGMNAYKGLEW